MLRKTSKRDEINSLYLKAVSSIKLKGINNSLREIYDLVDGVVVKKSSITPVFTSEDIQSQTYLKLLDWLEHGKKGKRYTPEVLLSPHSIKKTASSFGFSGARYPAQVCRLEDWSPVESYLAEEPEEEESSRLTDIWLTYSDKLDSVARRVLGLL